MNHGAPLLQKLSAVVSRAVGIRNLVGQLVLNYCAIVYRKDPV